MGLGRWLSRGAESGSAVGGIRLATWDDVQSRAISAGPLDRDSARGLPGVGHGVDLICAVIAPLTPHAIKYQFTPDRPIEVLPSSPLLIDPDPTWHGRSTWQSAVVADLMWDGNAFADKERETDRLGYPTRLPLIAPSRVTWDWSTDPARRRERVYVVTPDPASPWEPASARLEVEPPAMWHAAVCVDAGARMGKGILHRYQDVLRLMAAVERATWVVMRDGKPVGVLSVDADLTEPELRAAKAAFASGVRADGIAALVRAEFKSVGWSATDLALIPAREYNLRLAADVTGVPPYLLGVPSESRVYSNMETEWSNFIRVAISRYLEPMQDQFTRCLPRGQVVRYDTDDLARPDAATRWGNHKIAVDIGAMTIDEIRQEERLGPIPVKEAAA